MDFELRSERLRLRPLDESDTDFCVELQSDPEVMRFIREPRTRAQVEAKMPGRIHRCGGGALGMWCIENPTTEEKLGTGILVPMPVEEAEIDWSSVAWDEFPEGQIEVGYMLKPSAWGKGYATETTRRLLRFAFEETPLDEVVAVTDPANATSQKVLRKAGMTHEGLKPAYKTELPTFRITRQQWDNQT